MTIRSSRSDRRRFLRESALATAGIAAGMGVRPLPIGARLQQGLTASRGQGTKSLSRQFAQWVVGLRYEDLPPAVVDRAKGVTLQAWPPRCSARRRRRASRRWSSSPKRKPACSNGATIMVDGTR